MATPTSTSQRTRPRASAGLAHLLCLLGTSVGLALASGCEDRAVGGPGSDGGGQDAALPDADLSDAGLSCDPLPTELGCVEIVFPEQQTAFTQAEAAAGISFTWELVVPDALGDVYPANPDRACCPAGVGPLRARETVNGNGQYYCDCDHGMCDPSGCDPPPAMTLPAGRTAEVFLWPGVNWYGPSDTGTPYGAPFPRGTYTVRVDATGQWLPPGETELQSYAVIGQMEIEIVDGCGDRPALETALWDCTGAGEGGFCVELVVDPEGQVTSWEPEYPVGEEATECIDQAMTTDCFPSLAGTTESVCIYGV